MQFTPTTPVFSRLFPWMMITLAGVLSTGCDSTGFKTASSQMAASVNVNGTTSAQVPITPSPAAGGGAVTATGAAQQPASTLVGESCTSGDSNKLCLAIHFVTYTSGGVPTATKGQAATIIHTMNQLWAQCDIGFEIEKYDTADPANYGLSYGAQSQYEVNTIRQTFDQQPNELLSVTTGPWPTAVNAWTNLPGDGIYGSIMESTIVDYGGGIIYAHEFGHYLGLQHVSDTSNLMNPIIYTNSSNLYASQCQEARATAKSYWAKMLRN